MTGLHECISHYWVEFSQRQFERLKIACKCPFVQSVSCSSYADDRTNTNMHSPVQSILWIYLSNTRFSKSKKLKFRPSTKLGVTPHPSTQIICLIREEATAGHFVLSTQESCVDKLLLDITQTEFYFPVGTFSPSAQLHTHILGGKKSHTTHQLQGVLSGGRRSFNYICTY